MPGYTPDTGYGIPTLALTPSGYPTPALTMTTATYTIADICTGNACWLVELARTLQGPLREPRCMVMIIDISSRMFPNKENLPVNMELGLMDGFVGLREHVKNMEGGGFNLVRLRMVGSIVKPVERLERLVGNILEILSMLILSLSLPAPVRKI